MKRVSLGKLFKQYALLALIAAIIIPSLSIVFFSNSDTYAELTTSQQACMNFFTESNKNTSVQLPSKTTQDTITATQKRCEAQERIACQKIDLDIQMGTFRYDCKDPVAAAGNEAQNNLKNSLKNLVCSKHLDYFKNETQDYKNCVKALDDNLYKCSQVNDSENPRQVRMVDASPEAYASCIKKATGSDVPVADIAKAIQDGKQAVVDEQKKAQEEKDMEQKRLRCETNEDGRPTGKTWKDGKCDEAAKATNTCSIEGIGWIVCPVVSFLSKVVDGAYAGIETFLVVEPMSTKMDSPTFFAWSAMRNIANVIFIVAFLAIIYSQITGAGISNYGIKKMLPKLIIFAILINTSYWVSAVFIDISNLIGGSMYEFFKNIAVPVKDGARAINMGSMWTEIAGGALIAGSAGAVGLYAGLSVFLPLIVGAAVAIVTIIIILTIRSALIILLVVMSPVAFAANLLPNTEGVYKKWADAFKVMLIIYPVIALIFGSAQFAGKILMNSAGNNILLQMAGAAVTVLPLFAIVYILKSFGGIAAKIGSALNIGGKGPLSNLQKNVGDFRQKRKDMIDNRRNNRAATGDYGKFNIGMRARRGLNRFNANSVRRDKMVSASTDAVHNREWSEKIATNSHLEDMEIATRLNEQASTSNKTEMTLRYNEALASPTGGAAAIAGGVLRQGEMRARNIGSAEVVKTFNTNVSLEQSTMSSTPIQALTGFDGSGGGVASGDAWDSGQTVERRAAAVGRAAKGGSDEQVISTFNELSQRLNTAVSTGNTNEAEAIRSMQMQFADDLGSRLSLLPATERTEISEGRLGADATAPAPTFDDMVDRRIKSKKLSADTIMGLPPGERNALLSRVTANASSPDPSMIAALRELKQSVIDYEGNASNKGKIKGEIQKSFNDIKSTIR